MGQKPLKLYAIPYGCSMATEVSLMDADVEHEIAWVNRVTGRVEGDVFSKVNPMAAVPTLELGDGEILTENVAVLLYVAEINPAANLAPAVGSRERMRLHEWLSFVATEVHKQILWPYFNYDPVTHRRGSKTASPGFGHDEYKRFMNDLIRERFDVLENHLRMRPYLVGESFTVADAYLTWALFLSRLRKIVDLQPWPAVSAYLERNSARSSVQKAIEIQAAARSELMRQPAPT
jgi:glutathione S-transferase